MLCDNCNKNEATIHYTEVINGVKNERHLCSECMQELDYGMEGEFPFSKLIRGILSSHLAGFGQEANPMLQIKCNKCGMTYNEFAKIGKFGCSECYSVFGPLIVDNIKKIQGSSMHTGKKYTTASLDGNFIKAPESSEKKQEKGKTESDESSIKGLEARLKEAVLVEDYEEAARLRDEIRSIKERVGKNA